MLKKYWVLLIVLCLAVFFRVYNFEKSFSFAHDQDLYSWIAKDIVVNGHMRLAGQVTSVDGVFIGPIYYYLMAFSYWLFGMNPLGVLPILTVIGVFTVWSFYFIVKKFFSERSGVIAAFIYAVSVGAAFFDRWSVPTQPTMLWSVWFIYVILDLFRGNKKSLLLYAFLVGIVWNVHIALLPLLPLPFVSYLIGENFKEKYNNEFWKLLVLSAVVFFVSCSPFFIFEIKHNFSQIRSTLAATKKDLGWPTGMVKFRKVLNASGKEMQQKIVFGYEKVVVECFWLVWIFLVIMVLRSKKITFREMVIFNSWVFLIMLAQYTSKRQVSEYYFSNLFPLFVVLMAIFFGGFKTRWLAIIAAVYLSLNLWWLIKKSDVDHSYLYRRQLVEYIAKKVKDKGYPCISINYIADFGVGVGFRYLFWYNGVQVVKSDPAVMGYDIVIPYNVSESEISRKFGRFGVIEHKDLDAIDVDICKEKRLELEPLLGYTE